MLSIPWQPLPALVAVSILVVAAAAQVSRGRVHNLLTLPALVAGWGFAVFVTASGGLPRQALLSSVLATVVALVILLPAYNRVALGAGCIKAQMAFAAWLGAAVPLVPALALVGAVTLGGLVVTLACLRLAAAGVPAEEQETYEFPAQVTFTLVALVGTLACWLLSNPI